MRTVMRLFVLASLTAGCEPPREVDVGEIQSGLKVCAAGKVVEGVDVSHWQGTINWTSVKNAGVDFAIMKATEGTTYSDPTYATNWANSAKAGVIHGAYHFFRPSVDATAQANWFVSKAGVPQPGELPLTLDLEVTDGVAGATVAQRALVFLARVEQLSGRTPMIYTSPSFFTSTLGNPPGFGKYPLWIAHWGVTCPNIPSPPWNTWTFWQYTSTGSVAGISGNVDRNQFNGSLAALQQFAGTPGTPVDGGTMGDMAQPRDLASDAAPDGGGKDGGNVDNGVARDIASADGSNNNTDIAVAPAPDLAAAPPGDAQGGCSCRAGGASKGGVGGSALAIGLALLVLRRRRSR